MTHVRRSLSLGCDESSSEKMIRDNKLLVCKICERDCETLYILKKHIRTEHEEEFDGYKICCNVSLNHNLLALHEHIRLHLDKEAFKCQECGNCLTTSFNLKKHMEEIHTLSTNFVCPTCGKGFNRLSFFNKHINRTHIQKLKCEYCDAGRERS